MNRREFLQGTAAFAGSAMVQAETRRERVRAEGGEIPDSAALGDALLAGRGFGRG